MAMKSARGGIRTPTPVKALPPQSSVSTNSTTRAEIVAAKISSILFYTKRMDLKI